MKKKKRERKIKREKKKREKNINCRKKRGKRSFAVTFFSLFLLNYLFPLFLSSASPHSARFPLSSLCPLWSIFFCLLLSFSLFFTLPYASFLFFSFCLSLLLFSFHFFTLFSLIYSSFHFSSLSLSLSLFLLT